MGGFRFSKRALFALVLPGTLIALLGFIAACSSPTPAPTATAAPAPTPAPVTFKVQMGLESTTQGLEINTFFPNNLTINAGDTVAFSMATHEPHTVSLNAPSPVPDPFLPQPDQTLQANPAVFLQSPPAAGPPGDPTAQVDISANFDGTGFTSSGFLQKPQDDYKLTFTTPGTYDYLCLVHPEKMKGTITVNALGTARVKTADQYAADAQSQIALQTSSEQAVFNSITAPDVETNTDGSKTYSVYAGYGDPQNATDFMHFFGGADVTLQAGDSIAFTIAKNSPGVPHTISFLSDTQEPALILPQMQTAGPPKLVVNALVLMPSPLPPVPYAGADYYNSGLLITGAPTPQTYTLTFSTPGSYKYLCILHDDDGMNGTITVVAKP